MLKFNYQLKFKGLYFNYLKTLLFFILKTKQVIKKSFLAFKVYMSEV